MQSTNEVLMVQPIRFNYNKQTSLDNLYQNESELNDDDIQILALNEFDNFVNILLEKGVKVDVVKDTIDPYTPDSIFPNNWFSTHNGDLVIYPMLTENRFEEIKKFRDELIEIYKPSNIIDLSSKSTEDIVLEGTGAIVFDRENKKAYCSLSKRSDRNLFEEVCDKLGYKAFPFVSHQMGKEIYHTNVMMSITSDFAFIAEDLIDEEYRQTIISELSKTHEVIALSGAQILNFSGNVLELKGEEGKFLTMSTSAYDAFTKEQIEKIETKLPIVTVEIDTIEQLGGGSARCMMAEIFR
ncbi:citrulline utilization hydrolase CtlX [Helcococcus kunzii]|uniref:citrulline utilization hydrolase CtlX n=1 Tax=Helcococcus kunzii TaxID=40091 RepID=UPI0038B20816